MIDMEKTKIFALTATIMVLAVTAVAGVTYAQPISNPAQMPSTGIIGQSPQAASPVAGFNGGFRCPWLNNSPIGVGAQNGHSAQLPNGMRDMMGRLGW
jgi:hypothetical protein